MDTVMTHAFADTPVAAPTVAPEARHARFLRIDNVGMTFPTRQGPFVALRDVHLDVARGEFI
jgi:nitrate/nitrite transport system ATP-binding protein